jgi:hypothetical protein
VDLDAISIVRFLDLMLLPACLFLTSPFLLTPISLSFAALSIWQLSVSISKINVIWEHSDTNHCFGGDTDIDGIQNTGKERTLPLP